MYQCCGLPVSFLTVLMERHRVISEENISVNLSSFGQSSMIALAAVHVGCPVFDSGKPLGTW